MEAGQSVKITVDNKTQYKWTGCIGETFSSLQPHKVMHTVDTFKHRIWHKNDQIPWKSSPTVETWKENHLKKFKSSAHCWLPAVQYLAHLCVSVTKHLPSHLSLVSVFNSNNQLELAAFWTFFIFFSQKLVTFFFTILLTRRRGYILLTDLLQETCCSYCITSCLLFTYSLQNSSQNLASYSFILNFSRHMH